MTAFDAFRDDNDPGLRPLRLVPPVSSWCRTFHLIGPLMPLAFGFGLLCGSYLALVIRLMGG